MTWSELTVVVAAALLLLLWSVWRVASRLDRLHRKVATSRAVLDNQLVRRASAAAELASSGLLDPVSSVLIGEAAWAALSAGEHDAPGITGVLGEGAPVPIDPSDGPTAGPGRDRAESELSRTVRVALSDPAELDELRAVPVGAELLDALAAAWYRVQLARRFHNEAVAQTQRVRRKWSVRAARLAGHAPMPRTVEIDDGWPGELTRPGDVT